MREPSWTKRSSFRMRTVTTDMGAAGAVVPATREPGEPWESRPTPTTSEASTTTAFRPIPSVEAVLELLRRDLVRQLAKRGPLDAPPPLLGKDGASWQDGHGFDDLVYDAYVFIFLERLESLRLQLLVCEEIDGFVVMNVRHLLARQQRKAVPGGRSEGKGRRARRPTRTARSPSERKEAS